MFSIIHQNVLIIVHNYNINQNNHSILISLSGGQDSLCLTKLLSNLNTHKLWQIYLIHFNHKWRENADENSSLLRYLALILDLELYTYINYNKILSENHSRRWRYKVLFFLADMIKSNLICTAHTLTDNLETSFANFMRGCTLEGLTGFSCIRKYSFYKYLFRPLIHSYRDQIYWYCRNFLLPIWSDHTNYHYNLQRNRIRQELIPYFRTFFNSKIEYQLQFSITKIKNDANYLNYITEYFYFLIHHKVFLAINYRVLNSLHSSIKSRVIKRFIQSHCEIIINRAQTIRILRYFNKIETNNNILFVSKNISMYKKNYWLYLSF